MSIDGKDIFVETKTFIERKDISIEKKDIPPRETVLIFPLREKMFPWRFFFLHGPPFFSTSLPFFSTTLGGWHMGPQGFWRPPGGARGP